MDRQYSYYYHSDYYKNYHGQDYTNSEKWEKHFALIAGEIVDHLHPKTFLDVGCAMGYLVGALRDLGVEAYGIDISEYAIGRVREDIRPYCRQGDILDGVPAGFPRKFDCIACIEIAEHLYEEDAADLIGILCDSAETVLFSSISHPAGDITKCNVQQPEYWAKRFAQHGFFRSLEGDAGAVAPGGVLFVRQEKTVPRLVEDYERGIRQTRLDLKQSLEQKEEHLKRLSRELEEEREEHETADSLARELRIRKRQMEQIRKKMDSAERKLKAREKELESLREHCDGIAKNYEAISHSFFWRATKPFRMVMIGLKSLMKHTPGLHITYCALACMKNDGFGAMVRFLRQWRVDRSDRNFVWQYCKGKSLYKMEFESYALLRRQLLSNPGGGPKISVVVPLFNTPELFLREMIDSVLNQTYLNWELCLADASDGGHVHVGKICREYAARFPNVRYQKLEGNKGISENTNEAISMSTGDYIALFDHDDLLHPSALYYVAKAAAEKNADFIYTDELTFDTTVDNAITIHLKPDFAPDNLRSNNYICHLTAFSRSLYNQVGGFRDEYNGSQDYDMILRLTEKAANIVHIPHVLYYWRTHAASVASDISAKPYCIDAAHRALAAHLERCGLQGKVGTVYNSPGYYKIDYDIEGEPLISILIPNKDHTDDLDRCLKSIFQKTTYRNYEIIIIENNSEERETFAYYEMIEAKHGNVKVVYYEGGFNYSAINNFGEQYAAGDYILLLNNDTEVIVPNWLQEMLMYAQRSDVGVVGAKLYYPDNTVQHAGVVLGVGGVAGHSHKYFPRGAGGYMGRLSYAQNVSAVTGACMMLRHSIYREVNGLDESLEVAFNDVDFCLRIREKGYLVLFTPFAELYHYESISRGDDQDAEKSNRFRSEVERVRQRWSDLLRAGDPYYNPNLSLESEDFTIDLKPLR